MNPTLEIGFKILLAILISGIIGFEREIRQKGAGLRTHILVGVGSALVVLTSIFLYDSYSPKTVVDPTRMIAGVIQGIGFLCAGTIIRAGNDVRGLTSAATLWIVSCLGIAIGAGHYSAAVIGTVTVFIVLTCLREFERKLGEKFKDVL